MRGRARVHFRRARARLRRRHVFPMNTSACIWRTWAKSFHHVTCVRATLTWDRLRSDQRRAPLRLGGDLNGAGHASFRRPPGRFFGFFCWESRVTCCVYNLALSLRPRGCGQGIVDACCRLPLLPRVLGTPCVCLRELWVNTKARGV